MTKVQLAMWLTFATGKAAAATALEMALAAKVLAMADVAAVLAAADAAAVLAAVVLAAVDADPEDCLVSVCWVVVARLVIHGNWHRTESAASR